MSAQVMKLVQFLKDDTTEAVGASDAALGNVKPDNTSAIIATQKATAVPLELQRMAFYDMVEESCRIWLDMMAAHYGTRLVRIRKPTETGEEVMVTDVFDFGTLQGMDLRLEVEVGASTYWSELTQAATLSNLFALRAISLVVYLKNLPEGMLANKNSILDAVEEEKKQAAMAAQLQTMGGMPDEMPAVQA